mgnify:CR=1 FL=1
MKRLYMISFLVLACITVGAQDARQILDKTAAVVGYKGGASASFTMSGKYGEASGTISIKGNKFCAQTPQLIIWYDGKTQWAYNRQADEVNVSTPTADQQQALNPYAFINLYKQGFTLSKTTIDGNYRIHLKAQNQKREIKEMYIFITRNYQPTEVKIRNAKGWSTIKIRNFQKKNLSDDTFRFNPKKYPQAEVIDLR